MQFSVGAFHKNREASMNFVITGSLTVIYVTTGVNVLMPVPPVFLKRWVKFGVEYVLVILLSITSFCVNPVQ
jgi:hypothetical protein